ncbi:PTS lactose/cellobiose transporter subunit IIA [[Clostridium] innocuum]|nr:PTS lactose/cellobiose transporter subunit IIA [[Clostridium] innocuum]MCR0576932.1 PTS lactose/cellobiose transporter subunit IIA [[Clostridium] innocuum]
MDENVIQNAMQIILHAGDARLKCKKALDSIIEQDFVKAKQMMKEAQEDITKSHQLQTDAIQDETRGEKKEYSLLFAHAQDTLMTVYSELNIAKQMIAIFESYEKRLQTLEKQG